MNNFNHPYPEDPWEDFTVANSEDSDPRVLFDNYRTLKKIFAEQDKAELIEKGWIKDKNDISSLSEALRHLNSSEQTTLFRKNPTAKESKSFLWLSRVKRRALLELHSREQKTFARLDRTALKKIVQLSVIEENLNILPEVLWDFGIVLIYEKSLSGMKVDGATFLLPNEIPVIAISFRYPRLDNFWFTLMHELAHVVLHKKELSTPILDDLDITGSSPIEISANRLAKGVMVDRHMWRNCAPKYTKGDETVEDFARLVGVHKSIIAGLLRNERGNYKEYNSIIHETDPRKIVFND